MSVNRTGLVLLKAAVLSSPGTLTMMSLPGLNPSLRLYSATLIWLPWVFVGIAFWGRLTRSPVALDGSLTVNRLFGNGSRQGLVLKGWQFAAGAASAPGATIAPTPAKASTAPV